MAEWIERLQSELLSVESGRSLASVDFPELQETGDGVELEDDDPCLLAFEPWRAWLDADWDRTWARVFAKQAEDARSGKRQASPGDVFVAEQFWNDECTRVVADAVGRWGPHFSSLISDAVLKVIPQDLLSRIPDYTNTAQQRGMWVHTLENLISYYAFDMAQVSGLVESPSSAPELRCAVCNRLTSVWVLSPSIMKRYESIDDFAHRPIGPQCFQKAFWQTGGGAPVRDRAILIARLRDLEKALGGIPPAHYAGRADLFESVPPDVDRVSALAKAMGEMPPRRCYDAVFGSWLEALHAAGILEGPYRQTSRGVHCIARDGHLCHSLAEKMIDDWLSDHGVPHEREPKYPRHADLNPRGALRADWKVGEKYIEYFGLAGDGEYDRKMAAKVELARNLDLELIPLFQHQLRDLDRALTDRLVFSC